MALTDMYLLTTKNLEAFLNTLLSAQAPDRFTQKFLESLEFKSINDRLFIKMLKELGFLDASGAPTDRYSQYLDQTQSRVVLAEAIKEAYADLFRVNIKANLLTESEAKSKLKSLTAGKKSDNVYALMAKTFVALCSLADFSMPISSIEEAKAKDDEQQGSSEEISETPAGGAGAQTALKAMSLHYNIQIILPDTRDAKVYDAIFAALRKHIG